MPLILAQTRGRSSWRCKWEELVRSKVSAGRERNSIHSSLCVRTASVNSQDQLIPAHKERETHLLLMRGDAVTHFTAPCEETTASAWGTASTSEKQGQTPGITGQLDLEVRLEMLVVMTRMATVHYYCMERCHVKCAFWWQLGTCQARAFGEGVCVRHPLLLDVRKLPAGGF